MQGKWKTSKSTFYRLTKGCSMSNAPWALTLNEGSLQRAMQPIYFAQVSLFFSAIAKHNYALPLPTTLPPMLIRVSNFRRSRSGAPDLR